MVLKGIMCSVVRRLRNLSGVRATVIETYKSSYRR